MIDNFRVRTSPDELSPKSREFYENALLKLTYSLIIGAFGMMLLGFCSSAGAQSTSSGLYLKSNSMSSASADEKDSLKSIISSYGFSCFSYLVGAILCLSYAIYISPYRNKNETKTLTNPLEFDVRDNFLHKQCKS